MLYITLLVFKGYEKIGEDGTYVTRRYDLVPKMKAIPAEIGGLQPDDLWHTGAINSCEVLDKVEPGLEKIIGDIRVNSQQFVRTCRQNGAMQRRLYQ